MTLTRFVALTCTGETITKGLITKLKNMHEKPFKLNQVYLIRKLFNLLLKGESVTKYINTFTAIIGPLTSINVEFEDKLQAFTLLSSLPESWTNLITSMSSPMTKEELKLEDVKDLLLGEEMRRKNSQERVSDISTLMAESSSRGRSKSKVGKSSKAKPRSVSRTKHVVCWNCNAKGHHKKDCKTPRKGKEKEKESC